MAQSALMVYEPLDSIREGAEYWREYINFYEKFWDRPASPKSTWWGAEYDEFRRSLADALGIETDEIRDCFFTKKDGRYLVCGISGRVNFNIVSSENRVPFEWLLAFDENGRNFFYTHAGFGAVHHDSIYYAENIGTATERLASAREAVAKIGEAVSRFPELGRLEALPRKITEMNGWLRGFDPAGEIVLNYGEICSFITQDSMKNENSVGELNGIVAKLEKGDFEGAESGLRFLNAKWAEIADVIARSV